MIQFFCDESAEAGMRGRFVDQGGLFSYIAAEARVPANHPLRKIRELVRDVLGELTRSLGRLYASEGRPSIPPEQLLSALLLQVFYGIRSERQLMEQLDYNLLYRWFAGLAPDDPVWDTTTFTKNRDRLQHGEVFQKFMTKLLNHPQARTRPMIRRAMLKTCVPSTSRRMWRRTMARPKSASGGEARSMPARQGTRAMACRRSAAKWSNASLAGASSMARCARLSIAGLLVSPEDSC